MPAATVTVAGTVAAAVLLLLSETEAPPTGAWALRVTVPVEGVPPVTLEGLTLTEARVAAAGVTVRLAVRIAEPWLAEIVTVVEAVTAWVVAVKIAVAFPALTVTVAGTVTAAGLLLMSPILMPPAGAGALSVRVPVELLPPVTLVGFRDNELRPTWEGPEVPVNVKTQSAGIVVLKVPPFTETRPPEARLALSDV